MAWIASVVVSLALAVSGATVADDVPDGVLEIMDCSVADDGTMLTQVCGDGTLSEPHAVYMWSSRFLADEPGAPVVESHEWIAVRSDADGAVLGTALAWEPTEAEYELAGYDNGVELGELVLMFAAGAPPDAQLVHDAPSGAWYMLAGDTVTPLNDWAAEIVAEATPLDDARALVAEEHRRSVEACRGVDGCAGGGPGGDDAAVGGLPPGGPQPTVIFWTIGAIAGGLAIGLGVTAFALRRRAA